MSRPAFMWLIPTAAATGSPSTSMTSTTGMPAFFHHRARRVGMLQPRHDQTRGTPGQHLVDHVFFVHGVVFRGADTGCRGCHPEPTPMPPARRERPCSPATGSRRPRGSPGSRPARRRSCWARSPARARREHPFARLVRHVAALPQHAAYGHFRHARRLRHVAQRHLGLAVEGIASAQIWGPEQRR
jgi:hypothetical protein